jgi:hypothetical protein
VEAVGDDESESYRESRYLGGDDISRSGLRLNVNVCVSVSESESESKKEGGAARCFQSGPRRPIKGCVCVMYSVSEQENKGC